MTPVELSICIVTFNGRELLRDCLQSLYAQTQHSLEVIVVDNGSSDGLQEMLRQEYPMVQLVQNQTNDGYTRPMNQALRLAQGSWLVQLNPDTLVHEHALDRLVEFMQAHPQAGIAGPKVLNRDGTLQKPCRRGEPYPWAVISYFTGLSALFPHSKFFGGYLLNYLDEDETHVVDGVAGSCMLIRRELVDQIGYLDERFFAYQEDADYCARARQAGWQVVYYPGAQVTHYGGMGGSRVQPYRSIYEWHRSYFMYYNKHLARRYFFLFNWLYYLAMLGKLGSAILVNFLRREKIAGSRKP